MNKITVRIHEKFDIVIINDCVYFNRENLKGFIELGQGAVSDWSYTLKAYDRKLILFFDTKIIFEYRNIDIQKLFSAFDRFHSKKNVDFDLKKFAFNRESPKNETKSWAKLIFTKFIDKSAHEVIKKIKNEKPHLLPQVKEFLNRHYCKANVYSDHMKYSFYFDGRMQDGCGYNGGLIYHDYNDSLSVHT